jgi:hypothetical protein
MFQPRITTTKLGKRQRRSRLRTLAPRRRTTQSWHLHRSLQSLSSAQLHHLSSAPEQLELIFDLRSQMVDQLHRDTLMSQRIDMLFDAFSNAPKINVSRPVQSLSCSNPVMTLSPELRTTYPQVPMISLWFFAMGTLYNSCPTLCTGKLQIYSLVFFFQLLVCFRFLEQFCKNKIHHLLWFPFGRADGGYLF